MPQRRTPGTPVPKTGTPRHTPGTRVLKLACIVAFLVMALLLTGCRMDKNTEGPIYEKYDIVEVYNPDDDTSVTLEDDGDEPAENNTVAPDRTPANGEGTNTNR